MLNAIHEAGLEPHPPTLHYFQQHLLATVETMDAAYYALEDLANDVRLFAFFRSFLLSPPFSAR